MADADTDTPCRSTPRFHFLELPPELRVRVYELAFGYTFVTLPYFQDGPIFIKNSTVYDDRVYDLEDFAVLVKDWDHQTACYRGYELIEPRSKCPRRTAILMTCSLIQQEAQMVLSRQACFNFDFHDRPKKIYPRIDMAAFRFPVTLRFTVSLNEQSLAKGKPRNVDVNAVFDVLNRIDSHKDVMIHIADMMDPAADLPETLEDFRQFNELEPPTNIRLAAYNVKWETPEIGKAMNDKLRLFVAIMQYE